MAKQSGLNVRLYVMGNDLSGDANAIGSMGYTQETLETTPLNAAAATRITGLADGEISVDGYFDNAANKIHATFTSNSGKLPSADQVVSVALNSAVGDPFVGISSKEAEYNVSRSVGSAITVSSTFPGNGMGGEFGVMLTAHDDTHSSASNGTAVDNTASSASGGSGYIQLISLSSGSVTAKIQHSANNSTWTDLVTFTAAGTSDVPTAQRSEVTGTVNRYLRVTTTGTFSNAKLVAAFARF
ncbi:hypothetical protein [uncultured Mediterranean phage uvDeep-CGR2-KM18-C74]|nr:hypothetical protein [uncultured Mediterranean phage uvDeep-CGR2-KM18-C74]